MAGICEKCQQTLGEMERPVGWLSKWWWADTTLFLGQLICLFSPKKLELYPVATTVVVCVGVATYLVCNFLMTRTTQNWQPPAADKCEGKGEGCEKCQRGRDSLVQLFASLKLRWKYDRVALVIGAITISSMVHQWSGKASTLEIVFILLWCVYAISRLAPIWGYDPCSGCTRCET